MHGVTKNPLSGLFDAALAQRAGQPVAMNKNKLYQNYNERKQDEEFETKKDVVRKNVLGQGMMSMFKPQQVQQNQPLAMAQTASAGGMNLGAAFKQLGLAASSQKQPSIDMLSRSLALPQTGPKPPQRNAAQMTATTGALLQERPTEFIYEYDFDENGALYFLGSFGKKRLW